MDTVAGVKVELMMGPQMLLLFILSTIFQANLSYLVPFSFLFSAHSGELAGAKWRWFFRGQMHFPSPSQQCQNTEGN